MLKVMCSSVEHKYKEVNILEAGKVAMCKYTFKLQTPQIMWQAPDYAQVSVILVYMHTFKG